MRTKQDLQRMASHVAYEVAALEFTCQLFETTNDRFAFEAFLLHARTIRDFLWPGNPQADDAIADQFVDGPAKWLSKRGPIDGPVKRTWRPINKQLAHLTWGRIDTSAFVSLEPLVPSLAAQLLGTWSQFMEELPPDLRAIVAASVETRRAEVRTRVAARPGLRDGAIALTAARLLAGALRVRLVNDFPRTMVFARLGARESDRVGIRTDLIRPIVVFIEDREFYRHGGVSIRAIVRALAGVIGLKRRSGGSTITQQLARTLFIQDWDKTYRRKLVEFLLAIWLEQVCSKDEILEVYLASVRFGPKVYGLASAMKHYFGSVLSTPSREQLFLLVERISNKGSRTMPAKIDHSLHEAVRTGVFDKKDAANTALLYQQMVFSGKLACRDLHALDRLVSNWSKLLQR